MSSASSRIHLPALASVLGLCSLLSPQACADNSLNAFPRGVADSELKLGYVTSFRHTVMCLDLKSGKFVWESAVDGVPFAIVDDRVVILTQDSKLPNVGFVMGLDLRVGNVAWKSQPFRLPEWVAIAPAAEHYFGTMARVRDGGLYVKWRALAWKHGVRNPIKEASGVVRIDLKSFEMELFGADKMPPASIPDGVSKQLEKLAARKIQTPTGRESVVSTAGKFAVAVDIDNDSVKLKRWDLKTDKPLPPIVLANGGPSMASLFPAAGLVLVRPLPPATGLPRSNLFQVFSLETGKRVALLRVEPTAMEAAIRGSQLYYVCYGPMEPGGVHNPNRNPRLSPVRQLRVVDLKTKQQIWSQALENLPWDYYSASGECDCGQ